MGTPRQLHLLATFVRVREAFVTPIGRPAAPVDIATVVDQVAAWDATARRDWAGFERRTVFRRVVALGRAIGDAIRLQRAVRTRRIDDWLAAAPDDERAGFESWRDAFFDRCDALAELATEGLV